LGYTDHQGIKFMTIHKTDICVIGGGAGGLSVAAGASQMGARVTLIEGGPMGGDCLNHGCVPYKALLASSHIKRLMTQARQWGHEPVDNPVNLSHVQSYVQNVIDTIAPHDSIERFQSLGVTVFSGWGQFIDKHTVKVGDTHIHAKKFVIATGSQPFIPPIKGLTSDLYLTNETIFTLTETPDRLLILGGGPIGMEMAQAFSGLGMPVTVVQMGPILPLDDPELRSKLRTHMAQNGVTFVEDAMVDEVSKPNGKITLHYTQNNKRGQSSGSHLLVATGRIPNIQGLALDKAGITVDKYIPVDSHFRTSVKYIYAIGDVNGQAAFTHAAGYQAGVVLRHALFKLPFAPKAPLIPHVTYTDPELAHVGLSQADAKTKAGRKYRSITVDLADIDRAQTMGTTTGMIKIHAHKNGRILGVSILAPKAGDLIVPWILAIKQKLKLSSMAGLIIPYPTLSDLSKRAAGQFYTSMLYGPFVRRLVKFLSRF
jgi:pyruvate/2-oxoglutarate dehydrogenase complex dihydrolipoamide dehydrogenase (E3) component